MDAGYSLFSPAFYLTSCFPVSPDLPAPYQGEEEQERLMGLYQQLHSCLHNPTRLLRYIYRCADTENLYALVSLL